MKWLCSACGNTIKTKTPSRIWDQPHSYWHTILLKSKQETQKTCTTNYLYHKNINVQVKKSINFLLHKFEIWSFSPAEKINNLISIHINTTFLPVMFGPHSEGSVVVGGLILHALKERQPQLSHQPFCYALMLLACVHYLYKDRQVHCNSSGFHSQRFQWATVFLVQR